MEHTTHLFIIEPLHIHTIAIIAQHQHPPPSICACLHDTTRSFDAVRCSELQCVAVCCSVLQCVAMCCNDLDYSKTLASTPLICVCLHDMTR